MATPKKPAAKRATASEILARFDKIENTGVQDAIALLQQEEREQEAVRMKNVISQINVHLRTHVDAVRVARRNARAAEKELETINAIIADAIKPDSSAQKIVDTYNVLAAQHLGIIRIRL